MRAAARGAGARRRRPSKALLPCVCSSAAPARISSPISIRAIWGAPLAVVAAGAPGTHATHGAPAPSRRHARCAQYLAHTFTCADARPNARRGDGARRAACVAGLLPVGRRTPTGARQRWGTALKLVPAHVLAYFNAVAGRFWDYEPSPRSVATAAAAARGTGPVKGGRARGMAARFAYSCPYLRT